MGKRGPKSSASQEKYDRICEMVRGGDMTLKEIAAVIGINVDTIFAWRHRSEEFREQYWEARRAQVESQIEEHQRTLAEATDKHEIMRHKALLDHFRWMAEKLIPAYQPVQKQEINHKGTMPAQPVVITWQPDQSPGDSAKVIDQQPVVKEETAGSRARAEPPQIQRTSTG